MPIIFTPTGNLDVSTDPSALPQQILGVSSIMSGAMTRCKNLRINQMGMAKTRDGSTILNSSVLGETGIWRIIEQGGTRYTFSGGSIYSDESSIASGLTDAEWFALLYNAYNVTTQNVFAINGTDRKRIDDGSVYEWGIAAPTVAPTIVAGALTGLTGDYNVKYTYCRKEGTTVVAESNPSDAATAAVTLANQSLSVTVTLPSDSQVTHIRIYRTSAGGSTYTFDQDLGSSTATVDTNTADASLGNTVVETHDRPPLGSFVAGPTYNGTLLMIYNNLMYYCLPKEPEHWPSTYYIEVSPPQFPGKAIVFYNGQPYYLTKNKIYYIQGSGHNTFFPMEMDSITGCEGPNCAIPVHGKGIYHVGSDGIYLWTNKDQKITQSGFEPIFRGTTTNGIPGVGDLERSWLFQFQNRIYFGYPGSGETYPTNCLVFDIETDRVAYYDWGETIRTVAMDHENDRMLAGDNSGYVWKLEDTSVTTDDSTAISWEVQSKDFTLPTRAHFPRYAKYDVDASDDSCTATGTIYLDGTSHQTHSITTNRNVKKRLIATGNGNRASLKISGTGPVSIHAVEME